MKQRSTKLIRFLVRAWQAAKYVLPEYSNKFSRKDFTQHQLLALAALKQRIDEDYRDTVDSIGSDMIKAIGLTKVPHFTALQKFIKRIKSAVLDALIAIVAILILGERIHGAKVAIDASGYPSSHASTYYAKTIKRIPHQKTYLKGSFVADLFDQLIICCKTRNFPCNDGTDCIPLLKKAIKIVGKIREVHADKGYDWASILLFVINDLKAKAFIKIRQGEKYRCTNPIRKKVLERWNKLDFCIKGRARNLIETINSVVKRVLGDTLFSRNIWMRRKELKMKYFAYNVYRSIQLENIFLLFISLHY